MLNVTYKPFVLIVVMLSVIKLNVIMLSVVTPIKLFCKIVIHQSALN